MNIWPLLGLAAIPDELFVIVPIAVLLGGLLTLLLYKIVTGEFDLESLRAAYRKGKNDAGDP